jgi:hypothetical protein
VFEGGVDGLEVLLNDRFTAAAVGFLDGLLDLGDGLFAGQDAADGEEAGLHHGVDAGAHAGGLGDGVGVDGVELELLGDDLILDLAGEVVPDLIGLEGGVEEEGGAFLGPAEHVEAFQEGELVAGDEAGVGDEVGAADGIGAEAEVADGDGAGFLRVIDEVALGVSCRSPRR